MRACSPVAAASIQPNITICRLINDCICVRQSNNCYARAATKRIRYRKNADVISIHPICSWRYADRTTTRKLIAQARAREAYARSMLDQIAIEPGEIEPSMSGCGPTGVMDLLSERVGSGGVRSWRGTRCSRFVEMAQAEITQRGLRNVQVINADALQDRAGEERSFDVVHERLGVDQTCPRLLKKRYWPRCSLS